jgi:hypothetical protein
MNIKHLSHMISSPKKMTNKRVQSRVAFTGIGVVSPNGRGLGQFMRVASGEPPPS